MDSIQEEQIHQLFRGPLLILQIFGFMPVQGILKLSSTSLKFSWYGFRTIYALLTLSGFLFFIFIITMRICQMEITMIQIQRFLNYSSSGVGSVLFINLAKNWPNFIKKWQVILQEMVHRGDLMGLQRKIRIMYTIFFVLTISKYYNEQIKSNQRYYETRYFIDFSISSKDIVKS